MIKLTQSQQSILDRLDAGEQLFSAPDMNSSSGWRWTFGDEASPTISERSCKRLMELELISVAGGGGGQLAWKKALERPADAERVVRDGISFASRKEADRWSLLKMFERIGAITNLKRQVRHKLMMETYYVSDFEYDQDSGEHVVEDTKGFRTPLYKRKKKLMRQQHGIEIREILT